MNIQQENHHEKLSRHLEFHGSGSTYFPVWLVNVLLTVVTLGVFWAWALVRSKRYFYTNTGVAGARFSYHGKGGSIFLSWLFLMVLYCIFISALVSHHLVPVLLILVLAIVFLPWLVVQGTQYHMMMTGINQARFNFHARGVKAWWVIVGLPIVLFVGFLVFCGIFSDVAMIFLTSRNILPFIILSAIIFLIAVGVIQGTITAKWLGLIGNGMELGKLKFSCESSVKRFISIHLLSMLIMVPFLVIMLILLVPTAIKLMVVDLNGTPDMFRMGAFMQRTLLLIIGVYILGILVSQCFLFCALRRYFFSSLNLDGEVTLRSTMTVGGCLWQVISNFLLATVTLGLAYPWARVRFMRYMLETTWVDGDLNALDLQDHDEQPATNIAARLSRGIILP